MLYKFLGMLGLASSCHASNFDNITKPNSGYVYIQTNVSKVLTIPPSSPCPHKTKTYQQLINADCYD